jgi:hypothetical protein
MPKIIFDKKNENRPYVAANAVIFKNIKGKQYLLLGKRKNVAGHIKKGEKNKRGFNSGN